MHELSIATAILGLALEHAGGRRVTKIHLKVGHLRQVVPSALHFSFELAARETPAEGASLDIEEVPAAAICRGCGAETWLPGFPLLCGDCGGSDLELVQGEELQIEWLEVEAAVADADADEGRKET